MHSLDCTHAGKVSQSVRGEMRIPLIPKLGQKPTKSIMILHIHAHCVHKTQPYCTGGIDRRERERTSATRKQAS